MLKGKTVVLGITGSIAAYKMANVASSLAKMHCEMSRGLGDVYKRQLHGRHL